MRDIVVDEDAREKVVYIRQAFPAANNRNLPEAVEAFTLLITVQGTATGSDVDAAHRSLNE